MSEGYGWEPEKVRKFSEVQMWAYEVALPVIEKIKAQTNAIALMPVTKK